MNQFSRSSWMILTHSFVSLLAILSIIIFMTIFHLVIMKDQIGTFTSIIGAIIITLTLAVFFGVYFAGVLKKLKHSYLWSISKNYKYTLLTSFLWLSLIFNLMLLPVLYLNIKQIPLLLLLPFCVSVFSAYLVLGNNLLQKILIPATPLLIFQLYLFNFSYNTLLTLIIFATVLMIFIMYFGKSYKTLHITPSKNQQSLDSMNLATTGLSTKFMTHLNNKLGLIIRKSLLTKTKNIDWTIIMPHSKLALFSMFYVCLIVTAVVFITDNGEKYIQVFSLLFLASLFINLIMESRLLIRQTRTIAHIFIGKKHRQLKNRILFSIDKNLLINSCVFILGILLFSQAFSIPVNVFELLILASLVLAFALAYYPLLLCFQWINISFSLVFVVCIYVAGLFLLIHNTKPYLDSYDLKWFLLLLIFCCLGIRALSQYIFWHKPYELLLKNK